MCQRLKRLAWFAAVAVTLLGVAAYFYMNTVVRLAIEQIGSRVLQVEVRVNRVRIQPVSGSGTLDGLSIANPAGFRDPYALRCKRIRVEIEPLSLLTNPIRIRRIEILAPEIAMEGTGRSSNLARLERSAGGVPSPPSRQTPERKVEIGLLAIRDAQVILRRDMLITDNLALSLPDLESRNLGVGIGGVSPADAASIALKGLIRQISGTMINPLQSVKRGLGKIFK